MEHGSGSWVVGRGSWAAIVFRNGRYRHLDFKFYKLVSVMSRTIGSLFEAEEWERRQGEDVVDRTARLGRRAISHRRRRDLGDASKDRQRHVRFIHQLGQDVLHTQPRPKALSLPQELSAVEMQTAYDEHQTREKTLSDLLSETVDLDQLLSSNEEILDLKSPLLPVSMGRWTDNVVEKVCEYLLSQFRASQQEKRMSLAEILLKEVFSRHRHAPHVLRHSLRHLIHQATHQLLHLGQCTCHLNLLRILKFLAEKFPKEMTDSQFCRRFSTLLMLKLNLAAKIIQLAFRKRNFSKYFAMYDRSCARKHNDECITLEQSKKLFEQQYIANLRNAQMVWRPMQYRCKDLKNNFRCLSHIDEHFVIEGFEIMKMLTSVSDITFASINRNDVIESQLLILLPYFILCETTGSLQCTLELLYSLSLNIRSVPGILSMNIIQALVRLLRSQYDQETLRYADSVFGIIRNLANHNAGLYRAQHRYEYIQSSTHESVSINYLKHTSTLFNVNELWTSTIGSSMVIHHLLNIVMTSHSLIILKGALSCVYSLSCGSFFNNIIEEMGILSGKLIFRLAHLMDEPSLSTHCLALFLQISSEPSGRSCLLSSDILDALKPLLEDGPSYGFLPYHYAVYILIALYRQDNLRFHDPVATLMRLQKIEDIQSVIIEDIMRSITDQHSNSNVHTLSDILSFEPSLDLTIHISSTAAACGAKFVADYLSNPSDLEYYRSLLPHEYCSRAIIIDCISATAKACMLIGSCSCFRFLVHCTFYSSYLFQGMPMKDSKAKLVLKTASHAFHAMKNLCSASLTNDMKSYLLELNGELDILEASSFFIRALSTVHVGLTVDLKILQETAGISAIKFVDAYIYALQDHIRYDYRTMHHPIHSNLLVMLC